MCLRGIKLTRCSANSTARATFLLYTRPISAAPSGNIMLSDWQQRARGLSRPEKKDGHASRLTATASLTAGSPPNRSAHRAARSRAAPRNAASGSGPMRSAGVGVPSRPVPYAQKEPLPACERSGRPYGTTPLQGRYLTAGEQYSRIRSLETQAAGAQEP